MEVWEAPRPLNPSVLIQWYRLLWIVVYVPSPSSAAA